MEFYSIFKFQGTYVVNKLTLGDMIGANVLTLLIYIIIAAFLGLILPTILLFLYVSWMFVGDGGEGYDGRNIEQRLWVNILTFISSILFILDYHYAFLSYSICGSVIDNYKAVVSFNLTIGILSILYFFIGHELYRATTPNRLVRILSFLMVLYFGFKFISPMSDWLISFVDVIVVE